MPGTAAGLGPLLGLACGLLGRLGGGGLGGILGRLGTAAALLGPVAGLAAAAAGLVLSLGGLRTLFLRLAGLFGLFRGLFPGLLGTAAALSAAVVPAAGRTLLPGGGVGGKVRDDQRHGDLLLGPLLHIPLGPLLGHLDAVTASFAVAQDAHLTVVIAPGGIRLFVQPDLHGLPEHVHLAHVAGAVGGLDKGVVFGHALQGVLIGVLLIFQAAHQPPAGAGNFRRVQGQTLGLGHFDGHGHKVIQKLGTAEGAAADPQASQHLGLVPDADLPQLDAGPEHRRQVLYQLPEVHPPVGGEEEQNLVPLEAALHPHQLHLQLVLENLLLADVEGLLFPGAVVGRRPAVIFRGHPDHGPQWLDDAPVVHRVVAHGTLGVFQALGRLHDDVVPGLHLHVAGVKEVGFASAAEADADHSCHIVKSFRISV